MAEGGRDDISGGKEQEDHKACLQEPPGLRQGCRQANYRDKDQTS